MPTVHVFISTGRFRTFAEMRAYIDKTYDDDGDSIPSKFIKEIQLTSYEPACIEAVLSKTGIAVELAELLREASYADQWLNQLPANLSADSSICVFAPNQVNRPQHCSLQYVGGFEYRV